MTTILEDLIKKSKFKRTLGVLFGAGIIAASLFVLPMGITINRKVANAENYREQKVAEKILASTTPNNVNTLLIPYLKDNPSKLETFPINYENLQILQMIVSEKKPIDTNNSANLESKIKVDGKFRIDIESKPYFSEDPLSANLEFFPEINRVWDKGNSVLYTLSDEQRLTKPIRDVSAVVSKKNQVYVRQGTTLFTCESNKLTSIASKVYRNLQEITGTPFHVAFTDKGPQLLGEQEKQEKEELSEDLITRLKQIKIDRHAPYVKLSVFNDDLYFCDSFRFKIMPLDTNADSWVVDCSELKNPLIIDYLPLSTEVSTHKKAAFYEVEIEGTKTNYFFGVQDIVTIGTNSITNYRKISNQTLGLEYRFPINTRESDFRWLNPTKLKQEIKSKLELEKQCK